MTYIKPETAPNQSLTSIQEILNQGLKAVKQQDWLSVDNCLKSLPQSTSHHKTQEFVLNREDWQSAFEMALSMLIEADFQHKWSITKLIPLFGEDIIPNLTALVKDPMTEGDVRWFICQILGNFSSPTVVLTLVELLDSTTDSELIAIAGKTLTKIGNNAIDALKELLTKPEHRFLAVQSLSYIRTSQTIEPLLTVAIDSDPVLKKIAIKALGSFHDSRIPPILINSLQDKASNVRLEAAIALGFRPDLCDDLDLVNHLKPLLLDLNLEVCRQGSISLARMKRSTANKVIFEVLAADITPVNLKLDLVKALGWSEISSGIDYLEKTLLTSNLIVTQEIITILGRTTVTELKSQAAKVVVSFWKNNSPQLELPQLRQIIATSLGELHSEYGKATLEQLTQDSDRKVQLHAISALKKIVPH